MLRFCNNLHHKPDISIWTQAFLMKFPQDQLIWAGHHIHFIAQVSLYVNYICFFSGIFGETSKSRLHSELDRLQSCERANSEFWGDIMWTFSARPTILCFPTPVSARKWTWVPFASLHRLVGVDWLPLRVSPSPLSTCGERWRVVDWSHLCLDIWRGFLLQLLLFFSLFLNPVAN